MYRLCGRKEKVPCTHPKPLMGYSYLAEEIIPLPNPTLSYLKPMTHQTIVRT